MVGNDFAKLQVFITLVETGIQSKSVSCLHADGLDTGGGTGARGSGVQRACIYQCSLIKWQDDGVTPRGSVVLVHGLTQRGQCLAKLGKELAERGYIVWAIDQRGHGFYHFGQKAGSDGYICDYKQSQKDLVQVLKAIKIDHPELPSFCVGESAGAAIIAGAAADAPDCVNGIILASSALSAVGLN